MAVQGKQGYWSRSGSQIDFVLTTRRQLLSDCDLSVTNRSIPRRNCPERREASSQAGGKKPSGFHRAGVLGGTKFRRATAPFLKVNFHTGASNNIMFSMGSTDIL
jgi:hypothetical protein